MRIAPLPLMAQIMRRTHLGTATTCGFSRISSAAYRHDNLMGLKVRNLFHMPRVPVPPGIGIFFNQFGRRLNAVLSYMEGMVSEDEAVRFVTSLKTLLATGG